MKKFFLAAAMFVTALAGAQTITVNNTTDGGTIADNQTFTVNTLDSSAKKSFTVTNNTNESIFMRIRVQEMSGSDGSDVQLCFGVCVYNLSQGLTVPSFLLEIPANSTTESPDDHIWNSNPGNGTDPVIYTISFVQFDQNNNELGNLITFTYKYDATASADDFASLKNAGLELGSTILKNSLQVTAQQNATVDFVAVNGQNVMSAKINAGTNEIETSALATGVYIARFKTQDNKTAQIRVVKQ